MIRVTGINLLTYINWICDDSSHTRFSDLKKREDKGGAERRGGVEREREREERKSRPIKCSRRIICQANTTSFSSGHCCALHIFTQPLTCEEF